MRFHRSSWMVLLGVACIARAIRAQGVAVSGVVRDSLSRAPLGGAFVQIASEPGAEPRHAFNARADAEGRFRIDGVAPGTYLATFAHPLLDSLGIEAPIRRVAVRAGSDARVELSTPSAARLIDALCPANARGDSSSLLVGHVRDAATLALLADAALVLRWSEVAIGAKGVERTSPTLTVPTNGAGWFAVCNLPFGIDLAVRAAHASDTSGDVAVQVARRGVAHRELYVGAAERVADTLAATGDSATTSAIALWRGSARLRGTVTTKNGAPIAGARVSVWESASAATTDAAGAFTLADLPPGTRTLDVRAIGYVPERVGVDLLTTGDANTVAVSMLSVKAYLDTVRVTARTAYNSDANGFEHRRRATVGHFITRDDIAKAPPLFISDLMSRVVGAHAVQGPFGRVPVLKTSRGGDCTPIVYIDGMRLEADDLDQFAVPQDVDGLEVYVKPAQVPAQFMNPRDCGIIVMWTDHARARPGSERRD